MSKRERKTCEAVGLLTFEGCARIAFATVARDHRNLNGQRKCRRLLEGQRFDEHPLSVVLSA
jgi:hypothetical protein